jgi:hypothetical protein
MYLFFYLPLVFNVLNMSLGNPISVPYFPHYFTLNNEGMFRMPPGVIVKIDLS